MLQTSPAALAPVADYFKVLSEVSRLQVLCCLKAGAKNVTEIIEETGLGQANVSKHLKILAQAGILSRQPHGVSVYYEITDPLIFELCELVCDRLALRLQEQSHQLKKLQGLHDRATTDQATTNRAATNRATTNRVTTNRATKRAAK